MPSYRLLPKDAQPPLEGLWYAPRIRSRIFRKWVLGGLLLATVATGLAGLGGYVDLGPIDSVCTQCGATRRGRFIDFLGHSGSYGWVAGPNIISKCIEASNGQPCAHQWVTANCQHHWGCVLYRGRHPWSGIALLEKVPGVAKWIAVKSQSNPQFVVRLKTEVRSLNWDRDYWLALYDQVLAEAPGDTSNSIATTASINGS